MAVAPEKPRIYEGSRIPSPIPTVLQIPPDRRGSAALLPRPPPTDFVAGDVAEDSPRRFTPVARKFVGWMPKGLDAYEAVVAQNEVWLERTKGNGLLSAEDAIALGQTGPVLRGSGVD